MPWDFDSDVVSSDLRLTARWQAIYTITATAGPGGTVTPQSAQVFAGESLRFVITANSGYRVSDVLLDGQSMGPVAAYLLTNVRADHRLEVCFVKLPIDDGSDGDIAVDGPAEELAPPEADTVPPAAEGEAVPEAALAEASAQETRPEAPVFADAAGHWAEEAVSFVAQKGWMTGTAPGAFAPDETATRAMLATIFWRMHGEPQPEAQAVFADVTQGQWYEQAIVWSVQSGVMVGRDGSHFAPDAAITRQELVVLFYRLAQPEGTPAAALAGFADGQQVADWAQEAMSWAVQQGFVVGDKDQQLAPTANVTRAEIAVMLQRFDILRQGPAILQ